MKLTIYIFVFLFPQYVFSDQPLANQVADKVVKISERIWGRKLAKNLEVKLTQADQKHDSRYPSFWNPRGEGYVVTLLKDFELNQTWWNMDPKNEVYSKKLRLASLQKKYIVVLSHEITHLFAFPSPLQPWFQEIIGMRIGREIAIEMDSSLSEFFIQENAPVKIADLFPPDYDFIRPPNVEACRKFQREALWYSLQLDLKLIKAWVQNVRKPEYDPFTDKRSKDLIQQDLLSKKPL